jgi:hypothetical protein
MFVFPVAPGFNANPKNQFIASKPGIHAIPKTLSHAWTVSSYDTRALAGLVEGSITEGNPGTSANRW